MSAASADPLEPAPAVGPQEGRCGAILERGDDGGPVRWCRKFPIAGAARCRLHGAGAPQVKAAAQRRVQEAAALEVMAKYGVPVAVDWHAVMQESLDETYGNVLALRDAVQRMAPQALTWGISQVVEVGSTQFPGTDVTQAAGISPLVELYQRERDRLFRMAVDAGKLGLDVRRQRFREEQGEMVAEILKAALADFDRLLQAGELRSLAVADPTVQQVLGRVLSERMELARGAS